MIVQDRPWDLRTYQREAEKRREIPETGLHLIDKRDSF